MFVIEHDDCYSTCVGTLPELTAGERVTLNGKWGSHPVYGEQFKVETVELHVPTTIEDIFSYLSSGIVYGIGKTTAERLIEAFGEDTLDVLATSPQLVASVRGIGKKRALKICESYNEHMASREVMVKLTHFGITAGQATKIYLAYGNSAVAVMQNNPYRIIDDIQGIGFKTADVIALNMGVEKDSVSRLEAGAAYVLSTAIMNGHVYLPREKLVFKSSEILECEQEKVQLAIDNMITLGKLIDADGGIYLSSMYISEVETARRIIELVVYGNKWTGLTKQVEKGISQFPIKVSSEQKIAVETAVENPCTVITGGPGTGKTTIIKLAIDIFMAAGKKVQLCAPTGRAAKRMSQAAGYDAATIHRLLEYTGDGRFMRDEENPVEADVLIVDEMSMVDIDLMHRLVMAVPSGAKLILIGDSDQLMSVGAGNVLKDMISSGCIPTVRLNHVYRQGEGSGIVMAAHSINKGEMPVLSKEGDFVFAEIDSPRELIAKLLQYFRVMKKKADEKELFDIQLLCPSKKGELGTINLNRELQNILNPDEGYEDRKVGEAVFRIKDKVMQVKNNYNIEWVDTAGNEDCGVFNGDVGWIFDINGRAEMMTVRFDDGKQVQYPFADLDQLIHAYAMTVHKSQGSEFDTVLMVLSAPAPLLTRNLLYTAVTRAKKKMYLLGSRDTLRKMIENDRVSARYTNFALYLKRERDRIGGNLNA